MQAVIILTTAPAGSGKTYRRGPHFLMTEFLPERQGEWWGNLPIYPEKIAKAVAAKTGQPVELLLNRLHVIPEEELRAWRMGKSGPWEFFKDKDLSGAHISIDEIHNYCSRHHKPGHRLHWQTWLGEIRHMGATIEFISQTPNKIAKEIINEAGGRLVLMNSETRRDPIFKITLGDWYNLRAKFLTGEYKACVWEFEKREVDGRFKDEDARRFWLDPYYFQFYNSFSAPQAGGQAGEPEERPWQRYGYVGLLWWFFKRNPFRLLSRLAGAALLVFMLSGGGGKMMQWYLTAWIHGMVPKAAQAAGAPAAGPAVTAAGPVEAPRAGTRPVMRLTTRPGVEWVPKPEYERVVQQLKKVEEKAESGELVMVSPSRVVFRSWGAYRVGEVLGKGVYAGRRIESIDFASGACVLSGGVTLRVGGM